MAVKDGQVFELLRDLSKHYSDNINNRFLRHKVSNLPIDGKYLNLINSVADHPEDYSYRGMMLEELYDVILAYCTFVASCDEHVTPYLRELKGEAESILRRSGSSNPGDKIIMEMAISNFPHNLQVLRDYLVRLYRRVLELDIDSHRVKSPVISRRPDAREAAEKVLGIGES